MSGPRLCSLTYLIPTKPCWAGKGGPKSPSTQLDERSGQPERPAHTLQKPHRFLSSQVSGFSTFAGLDSHHTSHFRVFPSPQKEPPLVSSASPAPREMSPTFRACGFVCSGHFPETESHSKWSLKLASFTEHGPSGFLRLAVYELHSSVRLSTIPLYDWATFYRSVHQPMDV